jgi:hypothetical protein
MKYGFFIRKIFETDNEPPPKGPPNRPIPSPIVPLKPGNRVTF